MNPVLKNILGAIGRHWLTLVLGVLVSRGWMKHEEAQGTVDLFTNDLASNLVTTLLFALIPATWSFISRQRLKLRERVAAMLHSGASEHDVKRMISDTPVGARMAAIVTANPMKVVGTVGGPARKAMQPNE